jgi:inner membrane protein
MAIMSWITWVAIGVTLLAAELVTPGSFFILFFGLSGLLVALFTYFGAFPSAEIQWMAFAIISLVLLPVLRPKLMALTAPPNARGDESGMEGESVFPLQALQPGAFGRGEARGTVWSVKNIGSAPVEVRERCRVVAIDGLTLHISKEHISKDSD